MMNDFQPSNQATQYEEEEEEEYEAEEEEVDYQPEDTMRLYLYKQAFVSFIIWFILSKNMTSRPGQMVRTRTWYGVPLCPSLMTPILANILIGHMKNMRSRYHKSPTKFLKFPINTPKKAISIHKKALKLRSKAIRLRRRAIKLRKYPTKVHKYQTKSLWHINYCHTIILIIESFFYYS